jgi:hypothetical protein
MTNLLVTLLLVVHSYADAVKGRHRPAQEPPSGINSEPSISLGDFPPNIEDERARVIPPQDIMMAFWEKTLVGYFVRQKLAY